MSFLVSEADALSRAFTVRLQIIQQGGITSQMQKFCTRKHVASFSPYPVQKEDCTLARLPRREPPVNNRPIMTPLMCCAYLGAG